jgi:hypothetical protein
VSSDALTIVHALPGRVRLRLPAAPDDDGLASAVSALDGVAACTWSPRTRGLLVRYDPHVTDAATIVHQVALHTGIDAPAEATGHAGNGLAAVPQLKLVVPALFAQVNQRLAHATRGAIDLGSGIPVLLVAWAVLELVRGRTAPLAWSSALWYAHGLFRDYNDLDRPPRSNGDDLDRSPRSHGELPDSRT